MGSGWAAAWFIVTVGFTAHRLTVTGAVVVNNGQLAVAAMV